MKRPVLSLIALVCAGVPVRAVEPVEPQIESVGLFKNGLAVVRASFPVPAAGTFRWESVPRAVHGTFWVESETDVTVLSTTVQAEVEDDVEQPTGRLQTDLAGVSVAVTLKPGPQGPGETIRGEVWKVPQPSPLIARDAARPGLWDAPESSRWSARPVPEATTGDFLVLVLPDSTRRYIAEASIATVSSTGAVPPRSELRTKPVLEFDVRNVPAAGGRVRLSWLTKGMAWVPSYQLDLSDPAQLRLRQSALVRNELLPLKDVEVQLISGFPSVRFGGVESPLSPGAGLASFFQQLNESPVALGRSVVSNSMSQTIQVAGRQSLPELPEEGRASDDLHYHSLGQRSLKPGDTLAVNVAAETAPYRRIVEWTVPDPRDDSGRYVGGGGGQPSEEEQPWDAVEFANPLPFPMTTAPVVFTEGGKFRGQSQCHWANPKQNVSLRITRALSVTARATELEKEGERQVVWVGGHDYRQTKVKGTLHVQNFRGTAAQMKIRSGFSGELLTAEGKPEVSLRVEGVSSVNPRRELLWTVDLPPGAEKTLTYEYTVLVRQ